MTTTQVNKIANLYDCRVEAGKDAGIPVVRVYHNHTYKKRLARSSLDRNTALDWQRLFERLSRKTTTDLWQASGR